MKINLLIDDDVDLSVALPRITRLIRNPKKYPQTPGSRNGECYTFSDRMGIRFSKTPGGALVINVIRDYETGKYAGD